MTIEEWQDLYPGDLIKSVWGERYIIKKTLGWERAYRTDPTSKTVYKYIVEDRFKKHLESWGYPNYKLIRRKYSLNRLDLIDD